MTTPTGNTPPVSVTRLTFQDTFSSFSASASGYGTTWQDLYPYGGEAAHTLSNNSEAEYYSSALSGSNSPFNDSNGVLTISAFPAAAGSNPYNLPYTSGVITTAQSFSQTYGYFEVDAKLPSGQGLWPAFWALPTAGYTAELDDFEVVNNTNTIYSTVHGTTNGSWSSDSQAFPSPDLSQAFHVFGFNWTPTTVTYYLDGVEYGSAPTPQSMDSPMFLLLNLAVGGNGSWPGSPNSSTVFPANMQIAWVQAYATPDTTYVGGSASIPAGSSAAAVTTTTTPATTTSTTTTSTAATTTTNVTPSNPAAVTIGSGSDTLSLQIAEDYYIGDAQFTVSIDGVQQGGVQTTTAIKNLSETQTFNIDGTFSAGTHTVTVNFLNDAYGGSASTDRNLYVQSATIDGAAVSNSSLNEYSAGAQSFGFTEAGSTATQVAAVTATTTPTNPAAVTIGSGSDVLSLQIAEDYYLGDAQFTVAIDGVQQGGTYTTTAIDGLGETQTFNVDGTFSPGTHTVTVNFLNNLYAGTPQTDRNLYVLSATIDGAAVSNSVLNEYGPGPQSFGFTEAGSTAKQVAAVTATTTPTNPAAVTIGSGSDVLSLQIAEDYYLGDAQFTVAIDGVQQGGTFTTTAIDGLGETQAFNVDGTFSPGTHTVTVNFLNNLYAGTPQTDRNLYVLSATIDGAAVSNSVLNEYGPGPQSFGFTEAGSTTTTATAASVTTTTSSTAATPAAVTVGSGADTLSLQLAEDYYLGNAQFTVSVDGVQQGGTLTATAIKGQSQTQTFNIDGTFSPGTHTVTVDFLNDAYAGTAQTDRNLYVLGATIDGASISNAVLNEYSAGNQSIGFTEAGSTSTASSATTTPTASVSTNVVAATTSSGSPAAVTLGSGPDVLTLQMSEDYYLGDAQFTIAVDGVQQGGVQTTTAIKSAGVTQAFNIDGTFSTGTHTVSVDFLNDAYAGTPTTDRNLYLNGALLNGAAVSNSTLIELSSGTESFAFTGPNTTTVLSQPAAVAVSTSTTSETTPDKLVVGLTEDYYAGDAVASIAIDGKTIATPSVTFLNSNGTAELFTYTGNLGGSNVAHTLSVSFTNDLYGGTPTTDRNLYLKNVSFDGTSYADQNVFLSNGTATFTIPANSSQTLLATKTS